jgi:Uma2 family endonuclease
MRAPQHHRYTWQQYLSLERSSNVKHEFFDGEIFAMAGGSPEHAALQAAVVRDLGVQLLGKRCRPYTSDLRVRVLATGLGTYPDVSVVCGTPEYDPEASDVVVNPTLIVEVLSDSTESYDRGDKFENYKRVSSLEEYVLLSSRERLIEVFRRGEDDAWIRSEGRSRATVRLESIGGALDVERIYDGIDLDRRR